MYGDAAGNIAIPATVRRIGRDAALAYGDVGASDSERPLDPHGAAPRIAALPVGTRGGGKRHIAAFRPQPEPRADPAAPGERALLDAGALLDELDDDGRVRVARFLVEVCRSMFRLGEDPVFVEV